MDPRCQGGSCSDGRPEQMEPDPIQVAAEDRVNRSVSTLAAHGFPFRHFHVLIKCGAPTHGSPRTVAPCVHRRGATTAAFGWLRVVLVGERSL
jgi:hypothetical protein